MARLVHGQSILASDEQWFDRGVPRHLCAIDPGVTGTGVVLFVGDDPNPRKAVCLLPSRKVRSWPERAKSIAVQIQDLLSGCCTGGPRKSLLVVEMPAYWVGSDTSESAAESGNLVKLAMLVGVILQALPEWSAVLAPPIAWKGTAPKHVTKKIVKRLIGLGLMRRLGLSEQSPSHVWDALGIAFWALGEIQEASLQRHRG